LAALREANRLATGGRSPDLTVFLDIDPERGMRRKRGETEVIATGREALAFHQRVREGYLGMLEQAAAGTWLRIDAGAPIDAVVAQAYEAATNASSFLQQR
jgi:dTMP kinase